MSPASNPNALITDANIIISVCSKEPTAVTAESALENYAKDEAIENFQDQMKVTQTPSDAQFIKRAKEIQNGYGCSRSADSIYIALAEDLAKTRTVELLTFDRGMINQTAKNALTVTVKVL